MDRKIIFLDIDGTLTEPGRNEIPESAARAVAQARQEGHYVFLCTGRNYDMLKPLLRYGFDGVIGSSGGYVECLEKVIFDCPMTEKQRQTVMEILKTNGIFRTVKCMDGSYTDEGLKEFFKSHADEGGNSEMLRWREQIEQSLHILPMSEYKGQPVYKVVIAGTSMEAMARAQEALKDEFDFCIQERDGSGMINGEVVNKEFDKGRALERVCSYLNIPISDSIAIGDSMNDLEMLQTAGTGICMQNGSEKLKKIADDICPSVLEDGIYAAFVKYQVIHVG